jgi:hypothetical protein
MGLKHNWDRKDTGCDSVGMENHGVGRKFLESIDDYIVEIPKARLHASHGSGTANPDARWPESSVRHMWLDQSSLHLPTGTYWIPNTSLTTKASPDIPSPGRA